MKAPAIFPLAAAQSGVYAAPTDLARLKLSAQGAGLVWFELDLAGVAAKSELLACCQKIFGLPPTFGHNWDALADSLEDFSWQPARGYVIVLRHGGTFARHSPQEFVTALEIFTDASTYWAAKHKLFLALLDKDTRGARALRSLPNISG